MPFCLTLQHDVETLSGKPKSWCDNSISMERDLRSRSPQHLQVNGPKSPLPRDDAAVKHSTVSDWRLRLKERGQG